MPEIGLAHVLRTRIARDPLEHVRDGTVPSGPLQPEDRGMGCDARGGAARTDVAMPIVGPIP
jgi:hypothetical protein